MIITTKKIMEYMLKFLSFVFILFFLQSLGIALYSVGSVYKFETDYQKNLAIFLTLFYSCLNLIVVLLLFAGSKTLSNIIINNDKKIINIKAKNFDKKTTILIIKSFVLVCLVDYLPKLIENSVEILRNVQHFSFSNIYVSDAAIGLFFTVISIYMLLQQNFESLEKH